jgi:hypothetical protein
MYIPSFMLALHAAVCDRWSRRCNHHSRKAGREKKRSPNYREFRISEVSLHCGFGVLTVVKMKRQIFWVAIPFSSEGVPSDLHGIATKYRFIYFNIVSYMYSGPLILRFITSGHLKVWENGIKTQMKQAVTPTHDGITEMCMSRVSYISTKIQNSPTSTMLLIHQTSSEQHIGEK